MFRFIAKTLTVVRASRSRSLRVKLANARRLLAIEQSEHEVTKRQLKIAEKECESLAAVVARDRARIDAETARFVRQQAEYEGTQQNVSTR